MKKVTTNINGKETETTLTKEQLEQINKSSNMDKVYAYHNTTKEEFDKKYKNVSLRSKYFEMEAMIVAYKNNGWVYKQGEKFYYPWFDLELFIFDGVSDSRTFASVPLALCFKNESLTKETVSEFLEEYKLSRTTL